MIICYVGYSMYLQTGFESFADKSNFVHISSTGQNNVTRCNYKKKAILYLKIGIST